MFKHRRLDKTKFAFGLSILSGLLAVFSLPFFPLGWLSFFSFLPLFFALSLLPNRRHSFALGYTAGLILFAFTFRWFWDSYPLRSFGIENKLVAGGFIFIAWSLTALTMALFWGLLAWSFKKLEPEIGPLSLIIFPSLFVFWEYLRSFWLSILWFGSGTAPGPHWTAGQLYYGLHNSHLFLKLSSWIGPYGLLFVIALFNIGLFLFLKNQVLTRKRSLVGGAGAAVVITFVFLFVFFPFFLLRSNRQLASPLIIPAAIVQTAIPSQSAYSPEEQLSYFKKQLTLLEQIAKQTPPPRIVVFPEGSNFFLNFNLFGQADLVSRYFSRLFSQPALIVDNDRLRESNKYRSKTIFLNSQKGILASYDKYLLTPAGEYVPWLFGALDKVLGLNSPELSKVQEFKRGERPSSLIESGYLRVSALVCSDVASPLLGRQAGGNSRNLLVVQASYGFVNGSSDLVKQTQAMAQFRAAENGQSIIFASNFGPSLLIDPQGKVAAKTQKVGFEILTAPLVLNSQGTLYNKAGDNPMIAGSLGVLILAVFWRKRL